MLKKLFNWAKQSKVKEVSEIPEKSPTSSTMHILIDYENLLPQNLDKIPRNENSHIWLFVGSRQTKLNAGLVRAMQDFGNRAHQIYLDAAYKQPNALDFILSYYLGYIAATYPQPHVAILSKDKGYEMVIDHARQHHNFLNITRYDNNDYVEKVSNPNTTSNPKPNLSSSEKLSPTVSAKRQPIVVKAPTSPFGQAFREAIIYLTDQEKYHPRMRERLENLFAKEIIMPIFSSQEDDFTEEHALSQAKKLVDQLRVSRLIEIEDKDVGLLIYHTDDESLYQRMKYFVVRKQPKHVVPLKEMVAYNYSHREIDDKEIESLIERLKQDNILYFTKGGHITYLVNIPATEVHDIDELTNKAIEFLNRGHALPRNKSSLFNVIGTHTNTKGESQSLQMIIDRLHKEGFIEFDEEDQVIYSLKESK